jgi:hypothetical protein
MRQTMLATALLIAFGPHITPPATFTPIPAAQGRRECGWNEKCVKDCGGDAQCKRGCRLSCH